MAKDFLVSLRFSANLRAASYLFWPVPCRVSSSKTAKRSRFTLAIVCKLTRNYSKKLPLKTAYHHCLILQSKQGSSIDADAYLVLKKFVFSKLTFFQMPMLMSFSSVHVWQICSISAVPCWWVALTCWCKDGFLYCVFLAASFWISGFVTFMVSSAIPYVMPTQAVAKPTIASLECLVTATMILHVLLFS